VLTAAGLALAGCTIGADMSQLTDTIVDCTNHVMEVTTKTGQTFREAAEWTDETYDDVVLHWEVTDSWWDRTTGVVPLADGDVTVRDWKDKTSFSIPFAERRIQNPLFLTMWDGTNPAIVGVGGCAEADIQVFTWLDPSTSEFDADLPVFLVSAVSDARYLAATDTSLIELGGTAQPTGFTLASDGAAAYIVTVTGVTGDGTVTVTVPPGYVVDTWGATNSEGHTTTMTLDRTPPAFAEAADIDAGYAALDATSKVVAFATPVVTDVNLDGAASCSPASGSAFPVGTTTVGCTAADRAGNIGSSEFTVTVAAAPRAAHTLVMTGPAAATEGDTASFAFEARNSQGESLGARTGRVTLTSSGASDALSGDDVVFGFDPAAIGGRATHTITATLDDDPTVRTSANVEVASTAASLHIRSLQGTAPTVAQGGSMTFVVDALDGDGAVLGDASGHVVLTSDVPSDVVDGTTVTFPHASPHRITATAIGDPALSASVLVEVIPAAVPTAIAATGATDATPLLITGIAAVVLGALVLLGSRRRSGRSPR
jgi:hypothetical protein